jgi:hypothetical protein
LDQCLLMSLLQAGHRKHIDRLSVRRTVTRSGLSKAQPHICILGMRFREDVEEEEKKRLEAEQAVDAAATAAASSGGAAPDIEDNNAEKPTSVEEDVRDTTRRSESESLVKKHAPLNVQTQEGVKKYVCGYFEQFREDCHWIYTLLHCADGRVADDIPPLPATLEEFEPWIYCV